MRNKKKEDPQQKQEEATKALITASTTSGHNHPGGPDIDQVSSYSQILPKHCLEISTFVFNLSYTKVVKILYYPLLLVPHFVLYDVCGPLYVQISIMDTSPLILNPDSSPLLIL